MGTIYLKIDYEPFEILGPPPAFVPPANFYQSNVYQSFEGRSYAVWWRPIFSFFDTHVVDTALTTPPPIDTIANPNGFGTWVGDTSTAHYVFVRANIVESSTDPNVLTLPPLLAKRQQIGQTSCLVRIL